MLEVGRVYGLNVLGILKRNNFMCVTNLIAYIATLVLIGFICWMILKEY